MADFVESAAFLLLDQYGAHAGREAMSRAECAEARRDARAAENWRQVMWIVQDLMAHTRVGVLA